MERKVGEKFKVGNIEFICEEYNDSKKFQCFSCSLARYGRPGTFLCKEAGKCQAIDRSDNKDVVFIGGLLCV